MEKTTRIPRQYIERVRDLNPLTDLIAESVTLKRSGATWKGCCPFHDEKTPSFVVYPDHFHCYGCGAHGDAIDYVRMSMGMLTLDAVRHLAARAGLEAPQSEPIDREKLRRDREARNARAKKREQDEKEQHDKAAQNVKRILQSATTDAHPYLASKGFPDLVGLISRTGWLIIPIWDSSNALVNAQYISPTGKKRFHPRARVRGCFHRIGRSRAVVLCEGYATGRSIHAALRARLITAEVRVCFSAGNLATVGEDALARGLDVRVVADRDQSGTGGRAAAAVGAPYWLPPEPGDANDWHAARGLPALADALRDWILAPRAPK